LVVNPFQDKKSKIYFKKNEFFLPSNSSIVDNRRDIYILSPTHFDEQCPEQREQLEKVKEKIDNTIKMHPQHNFLTFISAIKINNE